MEDLTVSLIPLEDDSEFWQHFCINVLFEVKDHVKQRIKKLFKDLYLSFANGLPDVNIMLGTDKILELISSKYEEDLQISFLTAICSALQSITIFRKEVMKSRLKVYIEKIRELKGEGGKELQSLMKYEEQRTKAENILQVSLSSIEKKIKNNFEVDLSSDKLRYDWAKATKALSILVTSETSRKFATELTTEAAHKMKKKKNCFEVTLNAQEWIISLPLGLETIRYASILDRSNFSPVTLLTNSQGNPHIPSLYQEKKRGCNISCKICWDTFPKRTQLTMHLKEKHKIMPFSCDDCQKSFRDKTALRRHMFIHTKEKKFKCEKCCKAFADPSTLRQHRGTKFCKVLSQFVI